MRVWAPEAALEYLEDLRDGLEVEVETFPEQYPGEDESAGVEFVATHWTWPPERLGMLAKLPDLRVVQVPSAGVDWILPYIPEGVTLCDARGVHDATVSEWVVAAILASFKHFPHFYELRRERRWERETLDDVEGSSVLIVGHGSIGRAVEDRLTPFGTGFLRVARSEREGVHSLSDLSELLPRADVVVVLAPLTPETDGLLDREALGRMRDGALLVNAARGKLVETEALVDELRSGRLRAVLDTTDPEPLPEGHPLWDAPGVVITQHTAGGTGKFPERAWRMVREQVERYAANEPLANVVDEEGY